MRFQQGKLLGQFLTALLLCGCTAAAQELYPVQLKKQPWHGEERSLRYHPDGRDFVIRNGNRRFNRALYGSHTAFRVEAGDLPEFALYMPGMGGNLQIGLSSGTKSLWLIKSRDIIARYTPGKMSYVIHDPLLGKSALHVVILALADAEGMILKAWMEGPVKDIQLVYAFGGASGKKFSRSGDMGPDPESSFYLKPEDCTGNQYRLNEGAFNLKYGKSSALSGVFPAKLELADAGQLGSPSSFQQSSTEQTALSNASAKGLLGDGQAVSGNASARASSVAAQKASEDDPAQSSSSSAGRAGKSTGSSDRPALICVKALTAGKSQYIMIREGSSSPRYTGLAAIFDRSESSREKIAGRIKINTPDPYINTIGGAMSIASDAIWEEPSYMHGAVGWRMRLNGWRGPYTADPLGWHDRARMHFRAYAASQVLSPLSGPVIPDTVFHLARHQEKMGTSMFSSGYISRDPDGKSIRPHHYDMNLVYIDQLLWHLNWTGDLKFAREMWPVIQRHLAWEKRNFDPDNDGLYDAYAVIWASDALYYSGGAVTHSSAYNYRANAMAAKIAVVIGESPQPYQAEASKILKAINTNLWLPGAGVFAEYKDALGLKQVHPSAALWTVYHSIDSNVPDAFQAYQSLRYIDESIPHIPVRAKGLADGHYYTLSTTSWMPYTWSLNNVVMAESMHTALANWQAGRNEEGFKLFKSELLADMYLGGSPGNFVQISHYDAARGEAYRDFADPVGISSRAVVEGLFGIVPNALDHTLTIHPGFPGAWNHASISTPDILFSFVRKEKTDRYTILPELGQAMGLKLQVKANGQSISSVKLNGVKIGWKSIPGSIGRPEVEINIPANTVKRIGLEIVWKDEPFRDLPLLKQYALGEALRLDAGAAVVVTGLNDPQKIFSDVKFQGSVFTARLNGTTGNKTAFIQLNMNGLSWWYPLCMDLIQPVSFSPAAVQEKDKLAFSVINHRRTVIKGILKIDGFEKELLLPPNKPVQMTVNGEFVNTGTNELSFVTATEEVFKDQVINWNVENRKVNQRPVDLSSYFNASITQIFKNKYLSPRPQGGSTLQIPWQGIGDWPHPLENPEINDSGLRKLAGTANQISLPQGLQFKTPGGMREPGRDNQTVTAEQFNILFSSRWDNYPAEKEIPLSGKAGHAYFLMAGSTNPMQSQFDNGKIIVTYTDGSASVLILRNPETWWPIQEDYYTDGFAFKLKQQRPPRIHLKTGKMDLGLSDANDQVRTAEISPDGEKLAGQSDPSKAEHLQITGGAATVLDLPLDKNKELKSLRLVTLANDVVIGLMSVTLTL